MRILSVDVDQHLMWMWFFFTILFHWTRTLTFKIDQFVRVCSSMTEVVVYILVARISILVVSTEKFRFLPNKSNLFQNIASKNRHKALNIQNIRFRAECAFFLKKIIIRNSFIFVGDSSLHATSAVKFYFILHSINISDFISATNQFFCSW